MIDPFVSLTNTIGMIDLRHENDTLRTALQTQAEEAAKHNAWMSQVHGLCFDLGIAPGHIEDRLFEAIGRVNMLIEQRDELLVALKPFADAYEKWNGGLAVEHFSNSVSPADFYNAFLITKATT